MHDQTAEQATISSFTVIFTDAQHRFVCGLFVIYDAFEKYMFVM